MDETIVSIWCLGIANSVFLYAHDSIFLIKPSIRQFQILKFILLVFQQITGLTLNMEKKKSKLAIVNCTLTETNQ
jgi:hypothetical protein